MVEILATKMPYHSTTSTKMMSPRPSSILQQLNKNGLTLMDVTEPVENKRKVTLRKGILKAKGRPHLTPVGPALAIAAYFAISRISPNSFLAISKPETVFSSTVNSSTWSH